MRLLPLLLLLLSYAEDASLSPPAGYTEQERQHIIKSVNNDPQSLDYFPAFNNVDDFIYMHTPSMLSDLNSSAWVFFASHFAALCSSDQAAISKSITKSDIEALAAVNMCSRLTIFIPLMQLSTVALIKDRCAAQVIRSYARRREYGEKSMDASDRELHGWAEGLRQMQYTGTSRWDAEILNLWLSSEPTVTDGLNLAAIRGLSEDECQHIKASHLFFLSESQLLALTPECFASAGEWHTLTVISAEHRQKLRRLPPENFSEMRARVSDAFASALTDHQLASYNIAGCGSLPVHSIQMDVLSKITRECLQDYLLYFPYPGRTSLLPPLTWSAMPLPTTSSTVNAEVLLRLNPDGWFTFPLKDLKAVVDSHPDLCSWNISIDTHQLALSPACIVAFPSSALQIAYLEGLGPNLPSTHYASFPASMFDEWPNKLAHLLEFGLSAPHWQRLGDNFRGNEHPCALIREPAALLRLAPLQASMSRACFDSITCWSLFEWADVERLHVHTFGMLSIRHLQSWGLESVLRATDASKIRALSKNSADFCKELTLEHWHLFSADTIKGIHPSCILSLQFLAQLDEGQIRALPDDAFSLLDNSTLKATDRLIPLMRAEQLATLGLHVPVEHSPGQAFTAPILQTLPPDRLSSLNGPTIRAFSPVVLEQISSPHTLSLIPAASLVHLNAAHLRYIPKAAFAGLTRPQASMIGRALALEDLVDEEISPLVFLTSKKTVLKSVSRKAWEELRGRLEMAQAEYRSIMQERVLIAPSNSSNGKEADTSGSSSVPEKT